MTQTIVNSNFLQFIMILSPISIPKSRVQVSSHPDPDIELGWRSGTLHSPFKQNLRIYVIQANICFTVDVNFIQFSVNSTLYNTCSDSGYGLQSSSECWTNLVILVTLSWPGVEREKEGGDNAMFDGFLSPVMRLASLYLATGYCSRCLHRSLSLSHSRC